MVRKLGVSAGVSSRRQVLRAGGLAALAAGPIVGCDLLSTAPEGAGGGGGGDGGPPLDVKESPLLAERVKAGSLPPLEDRLPAKPLVVEPLKEAGSYGGTWNLFEENPPISAYRECGYDYLVRWSPDWTEVLPNLAEDWEVGNDGREFTFYLKEGVKWSDGEPFTAEDLLFAYDDVLMNEELFATPPSLYVSGGKPARLEMIDDFTVRFVFEVPTGLFLPFLASAGGHVLLSDAKHHFSQFHPKYTPEVAKLAESEGFASWADLFMARGGGGIWDSDFWRPGVPSLFCWITTELADQGQRVILERNPYYWKTDPHGRQLPYIDNVINEAVADLETALLAATAGEYDLLSPTFTGGVCTVDNKPVLARSREEGNYDFIDGLSSSMNNAVIAFNLTHKDPKLREVFQNKDFRIGLSYAINRQEIIDTVYQRQGASWQAAPREESEYYLESLAKQYTEYDIARANEHLDNAGYTERDGQGTRLRPDGEPISFLVDVVTQEPNQISTLELIGGYWKEVGIKMGINSMDRDLFYTRKDANEPDASVWTGDGGLNDALIDPRWYVPVTGESNYALPWADWYNSDGISGQEPPEYVQRQQAMYQDISQEADPDKQHEMFMELLKYAADQFWVIGVALPVGTFGLVRNDLHNVPESMIASWRYLTPGPLYPEQFYFAGN